MLQIYKQSPTYPFDIGQNKPSLLPLYMCKSHSLTFNILTSEPLSAHSIEVNPDKPLDV